MSLPRKVVVGRPMVVAGSGEGVAGGGAKEMVTLSQGMLTRWSDADITPDGRRIVVALTQSSRDLWLAEGMRLGGP